jgi:integrase
MSGHICERGKRRDGSTIWRARYPDPLRPPAKPTKQIEKQFRTKREAQEWLERQGASIQSGEHIAPATADVPFSRVIDDWRRTLPGKAPSTVARYEQVLRTHVLPKLGDVTTSSITRGVVKRFLYDLRDSGSSPGTVRKVHTVLSAVFSEAVENGVVKSNPCLRMNLPGGSAEKLSLKYPEVDALAESINPHFRVLVYSAAFLGLRAGELAALRVRDVDLAEKRVRVVRAYDFNAAIFKDTKTHENRSVPIVFPVLAAILEAHMAFIDSVDEPLFRMPAGGVLDVGLFRKRYWRPAVRSALPERLHGLRFHDLRRTFGTLLDGAGVGLFQISRMLGHKDVATTQRYLDLPDRYEERLAEQVAEKYRLPST